MWSHYNVKCSLYIPQELSFLKIIPEHIDVFVTSWHVFKKFPHGKGAAPARPTTHEQQFPLPHYSKNCHLPGVMWPVGLLKSVSPVLLQLQISLLLSQLLPTSRSLQPFSNPLHHFLANCTLIRPTTHVYQLAVNFNTGNNFTLQQSVNFNKGNMFYPTKGSEFQYRKHVLPYKGQWISIQETCFTLQWAVNFNTGNILCLLDRASSW